MREIWEPAARSLVCPINAYRELETTQLEKLEQLGCKVSNEIVMPFPIKFVSFWSVLLPEWLSYRLDEEDDVMGNYLFKDQKDRSRLMVWCGSTFFTTVVFTRYHPHVKLGTQRPVPIVTDRQIGNDDDDEESIVWKGKPVTEKSLKIRAKDFDLSKLIEEQMAEEWLDKNKPDWRNPSAYWD